jgi:hypothetical protein
MHDVAADRDGEALEPALVAADGKRIEQRLRGMLMGAVAGIDRGTVDLARQQLDPRPMQWCRTTRMSGCMAFSGDGGVHQVSALAGSRTTTPTCS